MYLSQVFSAKGKKAYSIVSIIVLLLLFSGLFSDEDSSQAIKEAIDTFGELGFYAISLVSFAFFFFPLFFVVKFIHEKSLTQFTTSRKKIDWSRIFFAIAVFGGLQTLSIMIDYVISPSDYQWNFQPTKFAMLFLISIALLPIQIGFEEYFFRGYFMQWLALIFKNRWVPFFASSILFGVAHASNPEATHYGYGVMFFYISAGFLFGILALMDDGLELALGVHFANNFVAAMLLTSSHTVFQTPSLFKDISEPSLGLWDYLSETLIILITIFIFAKKYHWNNWKQKLFGKISSQN